jgi:N-acetylneuraminic acid mutarotase
VVLPAGAGFVILGGLATGDVSTSRIVRVDPSAGQAQVSGQLAIAVHDSAGAQIHGEWFVFGGGSYSTVAEVQAWTAGRATELGTLPDARSDLTTAVFDGTAYIVGGFDGTAMTPDILATTDGVTFREAGRLAVPVRYAAVAAAGGYLWVVGGVTSTSEGGTAETDAVQRFDPATGQTAVVGRLPQAMGHATGITLNGTAYVVGGRSGTVPSAAIWRIDPARATLLPAGNLPQALSDAGSVVVGNAAYIVGGEVTGPTAPLSTVVVLRPHP